MAPDVLEVERRGDVDWVTMCRPHKHNAFDAAMRDALADALVPALVDPSIERVELRGRGRACCSCSPKTARPAIGSVSKSRTAAG